ncbi:MAG: HAD hydrolase-like protein [Nitriliruptoraceae bacterium]|nr:HAD hydrolase-like protein [Nitriliruptoraceae bacterium]
MVTPLAPLDPSCRLLLFDLDGCLVDSTPAITTSLSVALADAGVADIPAAELHWVVGPPLRHSIERVLTEADRDRGLAPALMDAYRAVYATESRRTTTIIDGMEALLDAAGADPTRTSAVVTSKPGAQARPLLDHVGLAPRFVAVHAPVADHGAEPKTQTLGRALEDLADGLHADEVVMIGDRHHDIEAGRAHGVRTVGVTWGAGDRAELEGAGADRVVTTAAALAGMLGLTLT